MIKMIASVGFILLLFFLQTSRAEKNPPSRSTQEETEVPADPVETNPYMESRQERGRNHGGTVTGQKMSRTEGKHGSSYDTPLKYDPGTEGRISSGNEKKAYTKGISIDSSSDDEPSRYIPEKSRGKSTPNQSQKYHRRTSIDSSSDPQTNVRKTTEGRRTDEPRRHAESDSSSSDEPQGHTKRRSGGDTFRNKPQQYPDRTAIKSHAQSQGYEIRSPRDRSVVDRTSAGKQSSDDDEDSSSTYMESEENTKNRPNTRFARFKGFFKRIDQKIGEKFDRIDDKFSGYSYRALDRFDSRLHNTKQSIKDKWGKKEESSGAEADWSQGYQRSQMDSHGNTFV